MCRRAAFVVKYTHDYFALALAGLQLERDAGLFPENRSRP